MDYIGQYELLSDKESTSSAVFWKAKKDGTTYFLKCFNNPKRPSERVSEAVKTQKNALCDTFLRERRRVMNAIKKFEGGNLVAPVDFFEHEYPHGTVRKFFVATQWREIECKSIDEIAALSEKDKLLIFRTAAQSIKLLNERGIIHLDIKPDNLPVAKTMAGKLSCSLIDFDSSYFEDALPDPDLVEVTDPYMSPELAAYKMHKPSYDNKVTVKNDVFALAIVFHMYWTGRNFTYEGSDSKEDNPYPYNIVHEGKKISTAPDIPQWLKDLLLWMINKDPKDRPTMAQVLEALKAVHVPVDTGSTAEPPNEEEVKKDSAPEPEPYYDEKNVWAEIRRKRRQERKSEETRYQKGSNFPEGALSFKVLPNDKVKIMYENASRTLDLNTALRKKFIGEVK